MFRGVLEANIPINLALSAQKAQTQSLAILSVGVLALLLFALYLMFSFGVNKPFSKLTDSLSKRSQAFEELSNKLSNSSEKLASASSEQASAAEQSVSSMSEINSMISRTDEYIKKSSDFSDGIRQLTQTGAETINRMVYSMELIEESNDQLEQMNQIINEVSGKNQYH